MVSSSANRPRERANSRRSPERVAVVGGGLVGLCSAYHLREAGLEVVVIERDRIGSGASRGNVGEVCPHFCLPLPAPGVVRHSLRSIFRRDSALYVRPHASIELARFLFGFARNSRQAPFERSVLALSALAADAVAQYQALQARGLGIEFNELPFLLVYGSLDEALQGWKALRQPGDANDSDGLLTAEELSAIEPCLTGDMAGFQVRGQLTVDPSDLVDRLAAYLLASGVEIREGMRATAVHPDLKTAVSTSAGNVEADAVVIASGVWAPELTRTAGVDLPIFPGKGYSFSLPFDHPPRHQIHLESPHVVIAPLNGKIRVGGTMELDRQPDGLDQRRIAAMVAGARPYLRGVRWEQRTAEWVGARPMTPTGLPFIGPLDAKRRIFVAAGHNMFGLTLALSTGRALAQVILEGGSDVDLSPFDPRARPWRTVRAS